MQIPGDLRYSTDHEWVRVDGDAPRRSGSPTTHRTRSATSCSSRCPTWARRSTRARRSARSSRPSRCRRSTRRSAGRSRSVNDALRDAPEVLNADPYGEGWICDARDRRCRAARGAPRRGGVRPADGLRAGRVACVSSRILRCGAAAAARSSSTHPTSVRSAVRPCTATTRTRRWRRRPSTASLPEVPLRRACECRARLRGRARRGPRRDGGGDPRARGRGDDGRAPEGQRRRARRRDRVAAPRAVHDDRVGPRHGARPQLAERHLRERLAHRRGHAAHRSTRCRSGSSSSRSSRAADR